MVISYIIIGYDYDATCHIRKQEWEYTYLEWWRCTRVTEGVVKAGMEQEQLFKKRF